MNDNALIKLDAARTALAECKTAMQAKQIADVAEAARVYLERTNASAETVNRATEIRLLAERQMGAFLKQMPKNQGARGVGKGGRDPAKPTLAEIGISNHESHVSQKLADIPEPEFRDRVAVAKASGSKLSTAKVLQPTRRAAEKFNLAEWKRHTATMLDLRFRGVPEDAKADAVSYATKFIERYLP